MPKLAATPDDAQLLQSFLDGHPQLRHLRATHRGATLTLVSGAEHDPCPHLRLTRISNAMWRVDMPTHQGRWESTPIAAPIPDVVLHVLDKFDWTLAPIG